MVGVPASDGIGIGTAVLLKEELPTVERRKTSESKMEIARFVKAKEVVAGKMALAKEEAAPGSEEEEILEAFEMMLMDEEIQERIVSRIENDNITASWAVDLAMDEYVEMFECFEDPYLRSRSADIKDIKRRLLFALEGRTDGGGGNLVGPDSILIAEDILPSLFFAIDSSNINGIILSRGNVTSHLIILAKSMSIPVIVDAKNILLQARAGDLIALDGTRGEYLVNPTEEEELEYSERAERSSEEKRAYLKMVGKKSITPEGREIPLLANVGNKDDIKAALDNDAEGIGLFRTEFLFMDRRSEPSEEEQYRVYKYAAEALGGKPVIIRTLDAGGDKNIEYLNIPKEDNPFLGYRAIRLCLDRANLFKTQLRAILRASIYGDVRIMLPMIASIKEVIRSKELIAEAKEALIIDKIDFNRNIKVGIMIETPSAAVISDFLAEETDFFSIGTNDLIQYTMAADRLNSEVSYLYNVFEPAVLRLIQMTIENGHAKGIPVGLCGEAGSNTKMVELLLGYGIDDISMSPASILKARAKIRGEEPLG